MRVAMTSSPQKKYMQYLQQLLLLEKAQIAARAQNKLNPMMQAQKMGNLTSYPASPFSVFSRLLLKLPIPLL